MPEIRCRYMAPPPKGKKVLAEPLENLKVKTCLTCNFFKEDKENFGKGSCEYEMPMWGFHVRDANYISDPGAEIRCNCYQRKQ